MNEALKLLLNNDISQTKWLINKKLSTSKEIIAILIKFTVQYFSKVLNKYNQ